MAYLDQSFLTTPDQYVSLRYNSSLQALAQQFKPAASDVKEVVWKLLRVGNPTGNIWVEIWTDNGSNLPLAQVGADSVAKTAASISTTATDYTFTFTSAIAVTPGTKYWITAWCEYSVSESNIIGAGLVGAGGYADGSAATYNGSSWSSAYPAPGSDYYFKTLSLLPIASGGQPLMFGGGVTIG